MYLETPYGTPVIEPYAGIGEFFEDIAESIKCKIFGDCPEDQKKPPTGGTGTGPVIIPIKDKDTEKKAEWALYLGGAALVLGIILLWQIRKQ